MQKFFFVCCYCFSAYLSLAQLPPIGQWREHLSYNQANRVVAANNKIFCATPYALFSVTISDNSIDRYSKVTGLHETGVQTIQWDDVAAKLIIAYNNSNVDILAGNKIYNIDAIEKKDIPTDKTIYNIFCNQGKAYLSSGIGIIVIDEEKYEVKDTYVIGNNGNNTKVNGFTTDGNFLYAATDEGLKQTFANIVNPADYRNWQNISGTNGLAAGACSNVLLVQGKVIVQKQDSLFALNGNNWSLLYTDDWNIVNTNAASNKLVLCQQKGNIARVIVVNNTGTIETTVQNNKIITPHQSTLFQNDVWIADSTSGLLQSAGSNTQQYQPNSPLSIANGQMTTLNQILWAASGTITPAWTNTFSRNGIYKFADNEWANYNAANVPALDTLYDIITATVDARDNSLWAGSFGGGLLQLNADKSIKVFKQNSLLPSANNNPGKYFIAGLAFDNDNNLWISDYGATQSLVVKKADGTWKTFAPPFALGNNAVSQILVDDYNQKWIVSPQSGGLLCFSSGQTIDNPGDDKWKLYKSGQGAGNLPADNVLCIAKDKNGFIWTGTTHGIAIIECAQDVFSAQGCDAVLPVVQQDNFAGYLFSDEQVQCITVDGADRKWIGTKNGAWLISATGDKIIYRFAIDNSPLLNNDVRSIAIDGKTGEVFFATASGICSFRSTATEATSSNTDVLVFPNPVPPGYTGTIAIRGLANNAIVKITEMNGRLVYQTRALGGQAIWTGKDYKGNSIASGVYLVLVSDDTRQEKTVTKIVFINK